MKSTDLQKNQKSKHYICRMEVTDEMVEKLANLSMLRFDENEVVRLKNELEQMIEFVGQLNEVNTDGVEPLLHISSTQNIMRDDVIENVNQQQQFLELAANKDQQFFRVPKVIKK